MLNHRGPSTPVSGSSNNAAVYNDTRNSAQDDRHTGAVYIEPEISPMIIDDVPRASTIDPIPPSYSQSQMQRRRSCLYNDRQSSLSGFETRAISFNSRDRRVQYKSSRSLRSVRPTRRLAAGWGEAHPRLYEHHNHQEKNDTDWESMDLNDDAAPLTPLPIQYNDMFHLGSNIEPPISSPTTLSLGLSPEPMDEQSSAAADGVNKEQASGPMHP